MAQPRTVTTYIDYKSPYAYLAKDLAYGLERDFAVRVDWLPYVLDIPSFLGSARVDDSGRVIEEERNAHQWRRVRYSYMGCRIAETSQAKRMACREYAEYCPYPIRISGSGSPGRNSLVAKERLSQIVKTGIEKL
jgi:hypothetical protein